MDNLYLIYGEEKKLIKDKIDELMHLNNQASDIIKFDLTEVAIATLLTDALMPSFLAPVKIIIGYNASFLTSQKDLLNQSRDIDELIKYINNPIPNTILIITSHTTLLDDRKKIVKALKKKAQVLECKKNTYYELLNLVTAKLNKEGYLIDKKTSSFFLDRVGNDLFTINNELDKLMLYKLEAKKITIDDIKELVPKTMDDNIFDLIDAAVTKNKDQLFTIYHNLLTLAEEPVKIIVLLANQLRIIYQTKVLFQKGYTEKEIALKLGIHPYRIKLAYEKSLLFKERQLLTYLNSLADLDIAIKSGKIDKGIGLDLFFLTM